MNNRFNIENSSSRLSPKDFGSIVNGLAISFYTSFLFYAVNNYSQLSDLTERLTPLGHSAANYASMGLATLSAIAVYEVISNPGATADAFDIDKVMGKLSDKNSEVRSLEVTANVARLGQEELMDHFKTWEEEIEDSEDI